MTERERFIKALKREPLTGLVPTFELVFYLTMEAFGKVHPTHRVFSQWNQMSKEEQELQIQDMAQVYVDTARKYRHSAIFAQLNPGDYDQGQRVLQAIRDISGDEFYVMVHGDPTFAMPDGSNMMEFSAMMYEEPEKLHEQSKRSVEYFTELARHYQGTGLIDGFALCSDYCFNTNPFFSREMFGEFITPYLAEILSIYRELGYYSIKHTDGNIMPIVDMMVDCKPDALHSLDPQGCVDLAEVKRLEGDRVCLIGNVNCGLLQTGTEEEVVADVKRALSQGMSNGYGYIFATSNCVYTGMSLKRYELMQSIWQEYGVYPER